MCTSQRRIAFIDAAIVHPVLSTIRECAGSDHFEVLAYCFMPDHLHLVAGALSASSDLHRFMSHWKQLTGFSYKRAHRLRLWQESYYDHVLRDDEETWRAVRYALENPVRKGLVSHFSDYPFCGSDAYSFEQLDELWRHSRQG
jgi:REP-associated tyrosine transposase